MLPAHPYFTAHRLLGWKPFSGLGLLPNFPVLVFVLEDREAATRSNKAFDVVVESCLRFRSLL